MRKYTREQLLFFLKKVAIELKKTPAIKDIYGKKGMPSSTTYLSRFGTWNNALKAAELKVNVRRKYEPKELSESLVQLSKELGRLPKETDLIGKDWIASPSTFRKYFGGWEKAIAAAGLKKTSTLRLSRFSKKSLN